MCSVKASIRVARTLLCLQAAKNPRRFHPFPDKRSASAFPKSLEMIGSLTALLMRSPAQLNNCKLTCMPVPQSPSRRFTSRVAGLSDLWVFWNYKGHDGLSLALDLSVGGLCLSIEKAEPVVVGERIHLNLLIPEGQIRTDAIVRHVRPERLGVRFITISEEDRTHLTTLMTRLRNLSRPQPKC